MICYQLKHASSLWKSKQSKDEPEYDVNNNGACKYAIDIILEETMIPCSLSDMTHDFTIHASI